MPEKLESLAQENKTILCFGIDPDLQKTPGAAAPREKIISYYSEITDALLAEHAISAIKPNYAYFAQYGLEGLQALKELVDRYRGRTFIILDGKRGDIGKSSEAYAREMYDLWQADGCTVSPYMGQDSVAPFVREGKLAYLLCRTSNAGAGDFQELKIGKKRLYEIVAEKAVDWHCGLVVGATSEAIKRIVKITKNKTPLLIPGIGAQGGDLEMILKAIKGNVGIHRINASSSLAFAYEKQGGNAVQAALKEVEKLNRRIRRYF